MDTRLARLAAQQHGVISRRQAADLGVGARALRHQIGRGDWERVSARVLRATAAPRTFLQSVWAAVLDAGPRAVVSHETAAALWHVPGYRQGPVHVSHPYAGSHRRSVIATVHLTNALPEEHITTIDGLPVTTPARTAFDLAARTHPARLARAVDNVLAMRLATLDDLFSVFARLAGRGRRGTRAMRAVLSVRDPHTAPAESELEARFLSLVRRYGLPEPERQRVLGDARRIAGRVDCYFRSARLVVELDGRRYHSSVLDREEDARRDLVLARSGLQVLRLTWHQVTREAAEVASTLRRLLCKAAA